MWLSLRHYCRPGPVDNEITARDFSFFITDREDGNIGGGGLILAAKMHEAHEDLKLNTENIQATEFNIATGDSGIPVLSVYRSPGSKLARMGTASFSQRGCRVC